MSASGITIPAKRSIRSPADASQRAQSGARRKRASVATWVTLAVVAGGLFLAVLSTTVVSVALPKIGSDLRARATELQWIVDAYVLVYASLLVAGGVLGDCRGRKGLFVPARRCPGSAR